MAPRPRRERLKADELQILKTLAFVGGDHAPVVLTSGEVGEKARDPRQQSADRHLMALAERGLIERNLAARRQRLTLTPAALEVLRKEYHGYRRIFEGPAKVRFTGHIASGLGEGRYYLSQPGYVVQIHRAPGVHAVSRHAQRAGRPAGPVAGRGGEALERDPDRWVPGGADRNSSGGATCYAGRLEGPSQPPHRPRIGPITRTLSNSSPRNF